MHELSVATNIIEIVRQSTRDCREEVVDVIHLKIGGLTCINFDALCQAFDFAKSGTEFADSRLNLIPSPPTIVCESCGVETPAKDVLNLHCPICGSLPADLRGGNELEVDSIELLPAETASH